MPHKDPETRRAYFRAWSIKRIHARRDAWFAENGPCLNCGTWERLEMDHIDASTTVSRDIWLWGDEKREAELAKCQVLCRPCHMEKTKANMEHAYGERQAMSKLTDESVKEIRRLAAEGMTYVELAKIYDIHKVTIRKACVGLTWNHVDYPTVGRRRGTGDFKG